MSSSSDQVQLAVNQLKELVEATKIVDQDVLQLYDIDTAEKLKKLTGLPAVAVVYLSLIGKNDSSRTGGSAWVNVGVVLIGAEHCTEEFEGAPHTAISMLGCLREGSVSECATSPRTNAKWQFMTETPVDIGKVSAYIQRWRTTINLIPRSS